MTLSDIQALIETKLPDFRGFGHIVEFDLLEAGALCLDARSTPPVLTQGSCDAECTIAISPENLDRLIKGDLSPTWAFTSGKLKVRGAMPIALKLASILED